MPSKSKKQQRTMGAALALKKGDMKPSEIKNKEFRDKVKDISKDMSEKELEKFASTKHKNLPEKKVKKEEKMVVSKNHKPKVLSKSELAKLGKEAAEKNKKEKSMKESYDIKVINDKLSLSESVINSMIDKKTYGSISKKQLMEKINKVKGKV
jgi:hypothetical protein